MQERAAAGPDGSAVAGDDQLALLFACCHPALDPASRVTLTLRVGMRAADGVHRAAAAAARADCGSADRAGQAEDPRRGHPAARARSGRRPARLASVLRAIYLAFTEGHSPHGTSAVVRDDLCEEAIRLARGCTGCCRMSPRSPGCSRCILLTSARARRPR